MTYLLALRAARSRALGRPRPGDGERVLLVRELAGRQDRSKRDGGELIILAVHRRRTSTHGVRLLHRLSAMAGRLSIPVIDPVIDQGAYILRQGAAVEDAQ